MGGVSFPGKKHYVGVEFNVIRCYEGGGVGWGQIVSKKCYVTREWPLVDHGEVTDL